MVAKSGDIVLARAFRARQERVRYHPIHHAADAAAGSPFAVAEVPLPVFVEIAGPLRAAVVAPCLARRAVHDVARRLRELARRLGEALLVVVVYVNHVVRHVHLHLRSRPREVGVPEKPVPHAHRREVVAPGVAVPLRILERRVVFVYRRVDVVRADSVVDGVCNFARGDPAREVPHESVVVRRRGDGGVVRARAAAQQRKLLVEESGHLVVEAEEPGRREAVVYVGRNSGRAVSRPEPDCRVKRVHVCVVAQEHVQVGKPLGREEELLVRVRVVESEREGHRLRLVEKRLVELYESDVCEVVLV